ncbi:MAG TPA: branched-chain amino acid ABC transporter permease [Actinomycetota bacterium]|jgi:branched-chain amino acid transport system permease protein|nr:branched-chain amino acid ABC transporter permease [Actinomycetota bacterium]
MPDCLSSELPFRLAGGLSTGAVYAMIALGYTLVYGVLQLINFAHSEVFMLGTLGAFLTVGALVPDGGVTSQTQGAMILLAAAVPAVILGGLAAVALERVAYRPLRRRGAPRLAYLISAIGASLFLSNSVRIWRGPNFETLPRTVRSRIVLDLGDTFFTGILPESMQRVRIQNRDILVFVVAMLAMVAVDQFINRSRIGRGIRAVAQDAETAGLMGVNINKVITVTFLIGGLLAGAAGLLFAWSFGVTRFQIGFLPGIKAFTAAVLGGIGNIRGALLGGLLLGVFENVAAGCFGVQWRDVVAFLILVLVLFFRPTGLLGDKEAT